jgi:membrane-bound serine protease (ClpP class)
VLAQGKLLNLSTQRALEWGVIPFAAASLEEALEQLGYEDFAIQRLEMTWQEKIFKFLTNPTVAGLLLMVGLGGIYLELKTPGLGAPGAIGVAALALFFGARAVLGLTDWIDMALVIIGCGLILAEVFLTPGFGILGGAGILCLIAGVILSFTFNDFTVPQYSWEWQRLEEAVHALAVTVIGLGILALLTWRYLPRTSLFNRLVLATAQEEDQGYVVQTEEQESAVGLVGRAVSDLRPVGRGRFQGRTYPVMSRAQYIEKGAPIKIIRVEGNRYLVDEAPEEEREEAPQ